MNTRQLRAAATKVAKSIYGEDATLYFTVNIYRFDKDNRPVFIGNYETVNEARDLARDASEYDSAARWLKWCFGPDGVYMQMQVLEVSFGGNEYSDILAEGSDRSECYEKFISDSESR